MERFDASDWTIMRMVEPMIPIKDHENEPDILVKVLAIGYKYCYKSILTFVLNQNAESVAAGLKYKSKYYSCSGDKVLKIFDQPPVLTN